MEKIDKPVLKPISAALKSEEYAFIERRALELAEKFEMRQPKRNAEVFTDVTPRWHVVTTYPNKERTAADKLSDRGFGIYLPESEHTEVRRGRKVDFKRLMLPGYVFVFVWDVDVHIERIRSCEGVHGLLLMNGKVVIIPDHLVDRIRVAENCERPLKMLVEDVKPKKRWRQSHKGVREVDVTENDIIGVHSYSPFIEALRADAEGERLSAFHKAIGLIPCDQAENQTKVPSLGVGS